MEAYTTSTQEDNTIFVGVDLHRLQWHVTVRTEEQELFSGTLPGTWEALRRLLDRFRTDPIQVVYEAGYFGFWLHDRLVDYGVECIVTPPSLVPQQYGNRVKTDRRDSRKLAHLLAKDMLGRVWVPTLTERYHRQVVRRRRHLVADRVRIKNRIASELRLYGIEMDEPPRGSWPRRYLESLYALCFNDPWMQGSFQRLLEHYEFLAQQISEQTQLLRELSETPPYQQRVAILRTVPGIGLIAAMELLVELQDVSRFRRADQLAASVGLTPSQYSSAEKIRMGRITGIGKSELRATLVEASWKLITIDRAMREKHEHIKARAGAKRAIVAISRMLLLTLRRMLLDGRPYALGVIG
jgi:transposase